VELMKKHPVAFGFGAGVLSVFLWNRRGWIKGLFSKLMRPFHGALGDFGAYQTGLGAGEMTMPVSSDPAIAFRQMRRYAFAAAQDRSPIVGLTHASYALAALEILEEAVGREGLASAGCDSTKMRKLITGLQDTHAKRLEGCDSFLSSALAVERGEGGLDVPGHVFADAEYSAPTGA
jgi:hypothetical protein